jgi:hypothetical protein
MKLFTDGIVAIDGSKFKAVNNRDKNFTDRKLQARIEQLEASIKCYLAKLGTAAPGEGELIALADRGYDEGDEVLECERSGVAAVVPKPMTSNNLAEGLFDKRDFVYDANNDEYRCHAASRANRDELAGSGLQPEAGDQDPRRGAADGGDEGVGSWPSTPNSPRSASAALALMAAPHAWLNTFPHGLDTEETPEVLISSPRSGCLVLCEGSLNVHEHSRHRVVSRARRMRRSAGPISPASMTP